MIPSVIPDPDRESRVVVLCISPSPLMGEEKGEGDAFAYSFPSFVRQPPLRQAQDRLNPPYQGDCLVPPPLLSSSTFVIEEPASFFPLLCKEG